LDKDRLNIISTLLVTVLLIAFAAILQLFVPGTTADNLTLVVVTAVIAKWLQQGAQQSAEKQAEKVAEAVATVKNGSH
jgi:UPF0716 family protein affecting phage T7 exclusion